MNYQPPNNPEPDFNQMKPYHYSMRNKLSDPNRQEGMLTDRRPSWKLTQAKLFDVASYMYEKTKDEKYLAPTASGDGGMRIDQFWVSESIAPAIVDYQVIESPAEASDHKGITFQLDTDKIDISKSWTFH